MLQVLAAVLDRGPLRHRFNLMQTFVVFSAPVTVASLDKGAQSILLAYDRSRGCGCLFLVLRLLHAGSPRIKHQSEDTLVLLSRCGLKAVLLAGFSSAVPYWSGSTGLGVIVIDLLYGKPDGCSAVCMHQLARV